MTYKKSRLELFLVFETIASQNVEKNNNKVFPMCNYADVEK